MRNEVNQPVPDHGATSRRADLQFIALIGLAHGSSHFSQLLLPPLFPLLKAAFHCSYTELGAVLTVFYVVSCAVQTASGFVVDRFGPRPVLFAGLLLLIAGVLTWSGADSLAALTAGSVVAGIGNGVFHPVDYTLINRKVHPSRLGHAYSVHGITGTLGWALAPALVTTVGVVAGWRSALVTGAALVAAVALLLLWQRRWLLLPPAVATAPLGAAAAGASAGRAANPPVAAAQPGTDGGAFGFLRIPAVWMCFAFFLFYATALGVVQAFAPEAARQLHAVPLPWMAACLTAYMVCASVGMVGGGFLVTDPARCERVVGIGMGLAALIATTVALAPLPALAVPLLFGLMGLVTGSASPSRDMLVKRSTPAQSSGRVYGVVYSGLDIGQALAPLVFGRLLDGHHHRAVWLGLALVQGVLIVSAFQVRRVRRELRPALAAAV